MFDTPGLQHFLLLQQQGCKESRGLVFVYYCVAKDFNASFHNSFFPGLKNWGQGRERTRESKFHSTNQGKQNNMERSLTFLDLVIKNCTSRILYTSVSSWTDKFFWLLLKDFSFYSQFVELWHDVFSLCWSKSNLFWSSTGWADDIPAQGLNIGLTFLHRNLCAICFQAKVPKKSSWHNNETYENLCRYNHECATGIIANVKCKYGKYTEKIHTMYCKWRITSDA